MKLLALTILLLVLVACGRAGHPERPTATPTELLANKYQAYRELAPRGWQVSNKCDALLFVSLQHIGLNEEVGYGKEDGTAITNAMGQPGQWFRLPSLVNDPSVCSSDISRDMFMGLLNYIWHFKRLDLAEQIWDYGERNGWLMGQERSGRLENRTQFLPQTIGLLAEVIWKLGGTDHAERYYSELNLYNTSPGFTSHLSLLHIHLRGSMYGEITDRELQALEEIRGHMAGNPFAQALYHKYTDGDQSEATRLLLTVWPDGRLPTERDWHEEWRNQRSDGDTGFQPAEGDRSHSGGDFLFAAALVLGYI